MTLIDAKKLIKAILDFPDCENGYSDTDDKEFIISEIEAQPTVDAVPVVHGHWVDITNDESLDYEYKCSECGFHLFMWSDLTNYCPNCGADMRGNDGAERY